MKIDLIVCAIKYLNLFAALTLKVISHPVSSIKRSSKMMILIYSIQNVKEKNTHRVICIMHILHVMSSYSYIYIHVQILYTISNEW